MNTVISNDGLPCATIREIALALFIADILLVDFKTIDEALPWSRRLFEVIETDPMWANGRHEGDCTQTPMTCTRCVVEEFEEKARQLCQQEGIQI